MLSALSIKNVAVMKEAQVEFDGGFTAITGETGAGKSVLLKAITLLSGERTGAELVRHGEERAEVSGLFLLSDENQEKLKADEDLAEILDAGSELMVRRSVDKNGRSRVWINDQLVTLGLLARTMATLMEVTGQREQNTLLSTSMHRDVLDEYAGHLPLRAEVRQAYQAYGEARRAREHYESERAAAERESDELREEVTELRKAKLVPGERGQIDATLRSASQHEQLQTQLAGAQELLSESAVDSTRRAEHALRVAEGIDDGVQEVRILVEEAALRLREAESGIQRLLRRGEVDADTVEGYRARLAELARLERKYRTNEAGLIEKLQHSANRLSLLEGGALGGKQLREKEEEARAKLLKLEEKLRSGRTEKSAKFSALVTKGLTEVSMPKARFEVRMSPCDSTADGADKIEFYFSANPGAALAPIADVASGGELSRLLLVLRTVVGSSTVKIFDEIDTGISGAVSHVVGEKLRSIATRGQVIAITHSPQIASLADYHLLVEKEQGKVDTKSYVSALLGDERVKAVASMIAGEKVTKGFEASAAELLTANKKRR